MASPKVLAIVLAGGEGKRLMPLTKHRAKPAVPFGGIYRLVDFALSNLANSHYLHIVVLTQYKSHSLDRHISKTWRMSPLLGNFVAPVPAQQRVGKRWYLGSADAIYQCLNIIEDERPDIVVVVGADHVYRMDFSQMVDAHVASGAEMTVAGIRQPIAMASEFGVIDIDPEHLTGSGISWRNRPTRWGCLTLRVRFLHPWATTSLTLTLLLMLWRSMRTTRTPNMTWVGTLCRIL